MKSQNLQFCFYYKEEAECPYKPNSPDYDNDAGFAWMSESICCKADDMDVDKFLNFIYVHMGKWDPYDYVDRFCSYLVVNTKISLEQRVAYAKKHFARNHPVHEKLKGL